MIDPKTYELRPYTPQERLESGEIHFEDCHLVRDRITHDHYCPTCPECTCNGEAYVLAAILVEKESLNGST